MWSGGEPVAVLAVVGHETLHRSHGGSSKTANMRGWGVRASGRVRVDKTAHRSQDLLVGRQGVVVAQPRAGQFASDPSQ